VTAVPRILLDPVHQDLSYGDAVLADAFTEVHMTSERVVGFGLLARQSGPSGIDHFLVGDRVVEVRVAPTVDLRQRRAVGDPVAPVPFASARWRISPSSDIVDGGTERVAICSAVKPSHFKRTVSRYVAR
jgi:hypothetical protein